EARIGEGILGANRNQLLFERGGAVAIFVALRGDGSDRGFVLGLLDLAELRDIVLSLGTLLLGLLGSSSCVLGGLLGSSDLLGIRTSGSSVDPVELGQASTSSFELLVRGDQGGGSFLGRRGLAGFGRFSSFASRLLFGGFVRGGSF